MIYTAPTNQESFIQFGDAISQDQIEIGTKRRRFLELLAASPFNISRAKRGVTEVTRATIDDDASPIDAARAAKGALDVGGAALSTLELATGVDRRSLLHSLFAGDHSPIVMAVVGRPEPAVAEGQGDVQPVSGAEVRIA